MNISNDNIVFIGMTIFALTAIYKLYMVFERYYSNNDEHIFECASEEVKNNKDKSTQSEGWFIGLVDANYIPTAINNLAHHRLDCPQQMIEIRQSNQTLYNKKRTLGWFCDANKESGFWEERILSKNLSETDSRVCSNKKTYKNKKNTFDLYPNSVMEIKHERN